MAGAVSIVAKEGRIARIRRHVGELVRLGAPIVLSRVGWMSMGLVDTIMVGRYATRDLAHLSMANSVVSTLFVPAMGLLMGTLVLAANAMGARRYSRIGATWRRGLSYSIWLGLGLSVFCVFGEAVLLALGQSQQLAREAGYLMLVYGIGLPFGMMFVVCSYLLEAIKRPMPALMMILAANVINIAFNWLLVYGNWGFPELGAEGSAWTTTVVRVFLVVVGIAFIWNMAGARVFRLRERPVGGFRSWRRLREIGYAAGLSFGVEHVAFVALIIFAGWLGELQVAAFTIMFNIFAMMFMFASGIGGATAVRVGIAYGRRDAPDLALAGWTGIGFNTLCLIPGALAMFLFPGLFARIFTDDLSLIAAAVPLFMVGALVLPFDGGQSVMASALRGRQETWWPTASHTLSYIGVMVPLSWFLAFKADRGAPGLMEGALIASMLSVALLCLRFFWLSWRDHRMGRVVGPLADDERPQEPSAI